MISLDNEIDEKMTLKPNEVLFKEGSSCKYTYIVKSGHVLCFTLSKDKRVIPIFSAKAKGLVGEDNIFMTGSIYKYNAIALTETILVRVSNREVKTYLDSAGDWMKTILHDLSEKVFNTQEILAEHKIIDDRLNGGQPLTQQEEKSLIEALN